MAEFTREFKKKENLETRGVNKGCSALPRVGGAPSGVEMLDTGGPRVKTKRLGNTWVSKLGARLLLLV